ncbi:MAG: cytochrome c oxidase cbb3-type subunit 2 [Gammaproteobacteria bacterium]|jgi:cytochrome c oxidase cbb3-type subunit 2
MAVGHERLETNIGLMVVLVILLMSVGGIATIVPLFFQPSLNTAVVGLKPDDALPLTGRDIYIREGCHTCHSQMIRPLRAETERYGHYSTAGEFVYDRPFLWGSKRTGPDLHRVGGRYSDEWHRVHLFNSRDVLPESIMPAYPWFEDTPVDASDIESKFRVLRKLGHPYSDEDIATASQALAGKSEMDAVVAYLQSLGLAVKTRR